jgi:transcriptional regulator with XRE-family HTH domain
VEQYEPYGALRRLIQKRVEECLEKKDLSRRQLAKKIHLNEDFLGKMVRGARPWKVDNLQRVADGLGVPVAVILSETQELPIVAEMGDLTRPGSFDYHQAALPQAGQARVNYPQLPRSLMEKTYVIQVTSEGLRPVVPRGAHLLVTRGLGQAQTLQTDDLVIYVDEANQGHLRQVRRVDPYIVFHAFYAGGQDSVRLAEAVSGVDMVVAIIPRADLLAAGL